MGDENEFDFKEGDRVVLEDTHHNHNKDLQKLEGGAGTIQTISDGFNDKYLVKFDATTSQPHDRLWVHPRWLIHESEYTTPDETEQNTDTEPTTVREERTKTMGGTTANITIEVENDGTLTDEEREKLAIALLEEGTNTDYASWDDNHSTPTRGNREI